MLSTLDAPDRTLRLVRDLPAPPALVWAAWTDPARLPLWWGPRGYRCETKALDLRPGGHWRFDMIAPDGTVYPNRHRYDRIEPRTRIDYRVDDDGAGNVAFEASARFEPVAGGTRLHLAMLFDSPDTRAAMLRFGALEAGYTTLDCLAEAVLGPGVLSITRVLDAPRDRVWRAWSDPAALAAWFFPDDVTVEAFDVAARPGRAWRMVMRGRESGRLFPASGRFETVEAPGRLVFTHGWEDEAGGVADPTRVTVTLEPLGTRTRLVFLQQGLASEAARAGHLDGWEQVLSNLARQLSAPA